MENMIIKEEDFENKYEELLDIRKGVLNRWNEIHPLLLKGGLTTYGSDLDKILFDSHVDLLKAEKNHLIGRQLFPGEMAASIPFDVPSFLTVQYTGSAFLAGMPVTLHFAKGVREVGEIWEEVLEDKDIKGFKIDDKLSGKEFGNKSIINTAIRHFTLAGGLPLVDFYKKADMRYLDTLTVFGPTRPKTLFLSDITNYDGLLEDRVTCAVHTSMFDSGQLCALDKELIPVEENYDLVKDIAIEQVKKIKDMASTTHYVAPITDKSNFQHAVTQLDRFKKNTEKYKILVGGKVNHSQQYIQPTLIEAKGVDNDIDGFWPYLIINKGAKTDNDAVKKATDDTIHGGYAFVNVVEPNHFYKIEKRLLGGHFSTVLKNANILNHSIGQPYGGFKDSFILRRRNLNGEIDNLKGNHYSAHIITRG